MRLLGYILLVLIVWRLLAFVPILGGSFIGLWVAVLLTSAIVGRVGERLVVARRDAAQVRALEAVDSPHNHGKLGSLLLGRGRARAALPHLERAREGEPDSLEWQYRLALAYEGVGRREEARGVLNGLLAVDAEYAYGAAQLRAAALAQDAGEHARVLELLDTYDKNHGESPESAFRRGKALRASGQKEPAARSFERVGQLAREAARYQRGEAQAWALRAFFAKFV